VNYEAAYDLLCRLATSRAKLTGAVRDLLAVISSDRGSAVSVDRAQGLSAPTGSYEDPPDCPESVTESGPKYEDSGFNSGLLCG